ncbi:hypothetical protein [Streptomyces sp. NPDC127072]|uniref:hypothetical protein n=1 Tax=Streptomyces sp. NPDC127072 TaxID=3347129 RepID=UPI0036586063
MVRCSGHPRDPPELALVDLGEDWNWDFDDEMLRKLSVRRLFARLHHDNGIESFWLIHRNDTAVERYSEVVWMEQAD